MANTIKMTPVTQAALQKARIERQHSSHNEHGRQVIDEKCSCGHPRSEHDDRFDVGHGSCTLCPCVQFTWIGWITC